MEALPKKAKGPKRPPLRTFRRRADNPPTASAPRRCAPGLARESPLAVRQSCRSSLTVGLLFERSEHRLETGELAGEHRHVEPPERPDDPPDGQVRRLVGLELHRCRLGLGEHDASRLQQPADAEAQLTEVLAGVGPALLDGAGDDEQRVERVAGVAVEIGGGREGHGSRVAGTTRAEKRNVLCGLDQLPRKGGHLVRRGVASLRASAKHTEEAVGQVLDLSEEVVHLARLALSGRQQDVQAYIHRLTRRLRESSPVAAAELRQLLVDSPSKQSPLRGGAVESVPVDLDTRLQLARVEYPVSLPTRPVWAAGVGSILHQVVEERRAENALLEQGLLPTRTMLFTGPPGVGKTLAARWLAVTLERPLIILDLASVMSSFLGRTGANVRHVLDYAKDRECVILLDELDAVAKRRDDAAEIGELKRLVTVLIQQLDDWPATGLLLAATNHPSLLDPAVWRRFERIVSFPSPSMSDRRKALSQFFGKQLGEDWLDVLATVYEGSSFNDIEREALSARRESVVRHVPLSDSLGELVERRASALARDERIALALKMLETGLSQRRVQQLTGTSRETLRKHLREQGGVHGR